MKVLLEVLQVSLCFTPIILLCGIYDLINSEIVLNDKFKYKTKNIFIIIFSLISFLFHTIFCFKTLKFYMLLTEQFRTIHNIKN